jgi:hypothetical protein
MPEHDLDVTDQVKFLNSEDEMLPLTQCICGQVFEPWDFTLGIYRGLVRPCPSCGRQLYFRVNVRVYEVQDECAGVVPGLD